MRGGSFRRVLRTQALRRDELPRTAPPVTGRLRSPPYPAAAPASTTTKPSPSRMHAGRLAFKELRKAAEETQWALEAWDAAH